MGRPCKRCERWQSANSNARPIYAQWGERRQVAALRLGLVLKGPRHLVLNV
jgi:hypothetical protein